MPRKGFKSITVPEDVYEKLQERARLYGTTPQNLILALLENPSEFDTGKSTFDEGSNPVRSTTGTFCLTIKSFTKKRPFSNNHKTGTVLVLTPIHYWSSKSSAGWISTSQKLP